MNLPRDTGFVRGGHAWPPLADNSLLAIFGVLHRHGDPRVAAAAAEIAGERFLHLVQGRRGVLVEQGPGGHDEARRAVAALQRGAVPRLALLGEGLDHRIVVRQALDGQQVMPSASTASSMHDRTALPSMMIVHAPHAPSSQLILRPVKPRCSRRNAERVVEGSRSRPTSNSRHSPLMWMAILSIAKGLGLTLNGASFQDL